MESRQRLRIAARSLKSGAVMGGNIIPLAAQYPQSSFIGIDIDSDLIGEGRQEIAALNLKNID
jgi:tRNA G46 methylase TrmB